MNCVIYGVICQYTPPYSPGGSRKKGDPSTKPASSGIKKRTPAKERASVSPGLLDGQDSPTSSYADELAFSPAGAQNMIAKLANSRRMASGKASSERFSAHGAVDTSPGPFQVPIANIGQILPNPRIQGSIWHTWASGWTSSQRS